MIDQRAINVNFMELAAAPTSNTGNLLTSLKHILHTLLKATYTQALKYDI